MGVCEGRKGGGDIVHGKHVLGSNGGRCFFVFFFNLMVAAGG